MDVWVPVPPPAVHPVRFPFIQGDPLNLDDVVELEDGTNLQDQAACAAGACEII